MDKDVLVQYYCVLVDKYIGLREPVIINNTDAMLARIINKEASIT
jgi:hypothetical protein